MTRANTEQKKFTPWFAQAGAASSILPPTRFVGPHAFATKSGGYGVFLKVDGSDQESLTDQELDSRVRGAEAAMRSLTEGFTLLQYTRVRRGYDVPRQARYSDPVTESFVSDRLSFLNETARFRRVDIHWCLLLEPAQTNPFSKKPAAHADDTSRMLAELLKAATIMESHLSHSIGLKLLPKEQAFQFLSYLFNLEEWAERDHLRSDTEIDRQIVKSAVSWEKDHLRVGKQYVEMFSLQALPESSRPCLFSGLTELDCDAVLCSTWRPKSTTSARKEIDQQEKFASFFSVGVMSRVVGSRDTAALDRTAGAKAAGLVVDDLSDVIRSLDKKAQGLYSLTLLVAAKSAQELRDVSPAVHRAFVDARAQVMEETLGNLSAFYAMFPGNTTKFQVFSLWLGEDHHARLSSLFAPHIGHPHSEDLEAEYLNVLETRSGSPFFLDPYVNGVKVCLTIGPTGSGKTTLILQMLQQIKARGESAIIYDPACEFVKRFYDEKTDIILNPLDERCPYWGPAEELRRKAEAKAIAASLYQPTSDKKGEFFTETPQKIFAHLLTFGPTPQELVEWMSNPAEIDQRVQGTELAAILEKGAQQQRAGVLASLGLIADSLRMLPTKEQAKNRTWSATAWAEKREGWIFITSKATEREALRPLHSLWIDLLVLRLLNAPTAEQRPVWFVLDELASLQRLPQLHTAITENRKSKNPLILGFQGKAQLETIYGHYAEVMLSQPATKIFLRTTEPKAAEWVSKAIGNIEVERMRETHVHGSREGKSLSVDRQTEPLVMDSEIAGLPDKHAFLKLGNHVARFAFTYCEMPAIAVDFKPRNVEDDELGFNPLTLEKRQAATLDITIPLTELVTFPADPEEDDEPVEELQQPQATVITSYAQPATILPLTTAEANGSSAIPEPTSLDGSQNPAQASAPALADPLAADSALLPQVLLPFPTEAPEVPAPPAAPTQLQEAEADLVRTEEEACMLSSSDFADSDTPHIDDDDPLDPGEI